MSWTPPSLPLPDPPALAAQWRADAWDHYGRGRPELAQLCWAHADLINPRPSHPWGPPSCPEETVMPDTRHDPTAPPTQRPVPEGLAELPQGRDWTPPADESDLAEQVVPHG